MKILYAKKGEDPLEMELPDDRPSWFGCLLSGIGMLIVAAGIVYMVGHWGLRMF